MEQRYEIMRIVFATCIAFSAYFVTCKGVKFCTGHKDCEFDPHGWEFCRVAVPDTVGECDCNGVHFPPERNCFKYASLFHPWCQIDEQCIGGTYGALSRCDPITKGCECFDTENGGKRDIVYKNGACTAKTLVGDFCHSNDDCRAITGDVLCESRSEMLPGRCLCRLDAPQGLKSDNCVASLLKNSCYTDEQCTKGSFGKHSRCSDNGKCECHDSSGKGFETKLENGLCLVSSEEDLVGTDYSLVEQTGVSTTPTTMPLLFKGLSIAVVCVGLVGLCSALFFVLRTKENMDLPSHSRTSSEQIQLSNLLKRLRINPRVSSSRSSVTKESNPSDVLLEQNFFTRCT